MLGFGDFITFLGYALVFLLSAGCIVYGIVNWNKEGFVSDAEAAAEKEWLKGELEIDEELSGGSSV